MFGRPFCARIGEENRRSVQEPRRRRSARRENECAHQQKAEDVDIKTAMPALP